MICTPPEARGFILRDCNHLWRVSGHPTGTQAQIRAPFAGTICSTSFLKPHLFEHWREAHSPECVEVEFCELRLNGVLGSPQNEPAHWEVRRAKVDAILLTCNSNQPIRPRSVRRKIAKAMNRDPNHLTGEAYSPECVEGALQHHLCAMTC